MEWLLLALVVGGGGGWGAVKWRDRKALRRTQAEELEGVRRLADEDVTYLGEQLQRLDREVGAHELDENTRVEYQKALDSYESAQRAVPRIKSADEISKIVDTLSSGRYALACVQARVAGRPVPELRVACFFNPQHGPSVTNVRWTQPGHGTRMVPACAQDAERVANREAPEVRMVQIGSRKVPYWSAGAAYHPYSEGYFASSAVLLWLYQPTVSGGYVGDFGGGGHGGGYDGGGYDGGGYDGGGFDGGGGGFDGGGGV
jgi:hypothetical protein